MTLIKWKPQSSAFPGSLSQFVDTFFNDDAFRMPAAFSRPSVNIAENEKEYRLEVAAPGFSKDEFVIEAEHDTLTISGDKKVEKSDEKEDYKRKEFSYESFKRSFTLPEIVDAENISAVYENGILNVRLPKKVEALKQAKKQISVG